MRGVPVPWLRLPAIGHLLYLLPQKGVFYDALTYLHNKYGDTFFLTVPYRPMVVTCDAELAKHVMMTQGEHSYRTYMWQWDRIFVKNGWPTGIPWERGEKWRQSRQVLNQTLMQVTSSLKHLPTIVERAEHALDCLAVDLGASRRVPGGLRRMVSMYSLDAMCDVLLGRGTHSFSHPLTQAITQDTHAMEFALSVDEMMEQTRRTDENLLCRLKNDTHEMRLLEATWRVIYTFAGELIRPGVTEYCRSGKWRGMKLGDESSDYAVIHDLLREMDRGVITVDELVMICVQAIAAAVDTTAQTTEFLLYNLGRSPGAWERLAAEARCESTDGRTKESYGRMTWTKACLRESLRLYPTVSAHVRDLTHDVTWPGPKGEMFFPKGTSVLINLRKMASDARYVSGSEPPDVYDPTRFLRGCPVAQGSKQASSKPWEAHSSIQCHPYAAIPFGHGARKCPGAGIAQVLVHTFVAEMARRYDISYDGPEIRMVDRGFGRAHVDPAPHFRFDRVEPTGAPSSTRHIDVGAYDML